MSECILHTGCTDRCGYGRKRKGHKIYMAHRLAYCEHHGVDIESISDYVVRHTCDNPPCVNPDHLVLGKHADNMEDRHTRDRQPRCEAHYSSKLTAKDVQDIRERYVKHSEQHNSNVIAKEYGVRGSTILDIIHERTWLTLEW